MVYIQQYNSFSVSRGTCRFQLPQSRAPTWPVCFMYVCRGGVDDFHELNIVPPQR
ncbi:ABC transporter G family member 51 [Clarias magur]|uniref:ABC transporter G family member 51 n=1 Tax=Clarias magur TaxID=1594786 RepID=A0A8J4TYW4_CLAMG|nr:ABC transporter G family member 51 [Clarias magur]